METVSDEINPKYYLLALVRAVVDAGQLPTFAHTNQERLFFNNLSISTLVAPTFGIDGQGYNTGNYLLGLKNVFCERIFKC